MGERMKLEDLPKIELKHLESTIGQLLIDIPDMKLSELQDKIMDILEES